MTQIKLTDLDPAEIAVALDLKPYQGRQIFQWVHAKRVFDLQAMTNLAKDLRNRLAEMCVLPQLQLVQVVESPVSGTRKALFQLTDGETVESVLIRSDCRITLCLSSQVGCALQCAFCATGQSGFTRDLRPGEIVEQALYLLRDEPIHDETPNIVYMGMGEPFRNYDATLKSIRLLMDKDGLGVGARKITVSTAGDIPGIKRFAHENWQVRLSISLHAANDTLRSQLVPLNRKYPLDKLLATIHEYIRITGRQVTFEWVLIDGINDSLDDAFELARLIGGLDAVVNLIPHNPVEGLGYPAPSPAKCTGFCEALAHHGIKATLRQERGQDIDAACGQLRCRRAM